MKRGIPFQSCQQQEQESKGTGERRSRERSRERLQRVWGMDAICWNRSAAAATAAAPHQCLATAPPAAPHPPTAQSPHQHPQHWTQRVCSPRVERHPPAPRGAAPRAEQRHPSPQSLPRPCSRSGAKGEHRTCFMGMARPLPILSALHSGTFLSRSGSAPFRDWKRRDTGALGLGTGDRNTRSPVPQQAPDLTTLLSPGPALPARSAAGPSPGPSRDARDTPAQPPSKLSSPLPRLQAELSSSWQSGAMWAPLPWGTQDHGDRQKWHGMQVEHGWKQKRLRQ